MSVCSSGAAEFPVDDNSDFEDAPEGDQVCVMVCVLS
jgi:hypothetical protein